MERSQEEEPVSRSRETRVRGGRSAHWGGVGGAVVESPSTSAAHSPLSMADFVESIAVQAFY